MPSSCAISALAGVEPRPRWTHCWEGTDPPSPHQPTHLANSHRRFWSPPPATTAVPSPRQETQAQAQPALHLLLPWAKGTPFWGHVHLGQPGPSGWQPGSSKALETQGRCPQAHLAMPVGTEAARRAGPSPGAQSRVCLPVSLHRPQLWWAGWQSQLTPHYHRCHGGDQVTSPPGDRLPGPQFPPPCSWRSPPSRLPQPRPRPTAPQGSMVSQHSTTSGARATGSLLPVLASGDRGRGQAGLAPPRPLLAPSVHVLHGCPSVSLRSAVLPSQRHQEDWIWATLVTSQPASPLDSHTERLGVRASTQGLGDRTHTGRVLSACWRRCDAQSLGALWQAGQGLPGTTTDD